MSTPPTSMAGATAKLAHARRHLAILGAAVDDHLRRPVRIEVLHDVRAGTQRRRIAELAPIPSEIALVAGDAVHNMRSALDHVVCELVADNNGDPIKLRSQLSVWDGEEKFKKGWPGRAQGVTDKALEALRDLKPYRGGNDRLWRLHRLDVIDKHRLLLTVVASHRGAWLHFFPLAVELRAADRSVVVQGSVSRPSDAVSEAFIPTVPTFDVCLDEPEIGDLVVLPRGLEEMADMVEASIARLGLVDAPQH